LVYSEVNKKSYLDHMCETIQKGRKEKEKKNYEYLVCIAVAPLTTVLAVLNYLYAPGLH